MRIPSVSRAWRHSRTRAVVIAVAFVAAFSGLTAPSAATTASPPPAGGRFSVLPPGSSLPSGASCASAIQRSAWEPRPENGAPNQTVPTGVQLPGFTLADGYDAGARALADRVTGAFTGTTDEIIQWGSCKWGINDDIVRAIAAIESSWYQRLLSADGLPVKGKGFGDFSDNPAKCQTGYSTPCPQSFGLLQVKATSEIGTFPWSRDSTAFNVDYMLMVWRSCYEGKVAWLRMYPGGPVPYVSGDVWGCVGFWYSGDWYGASGDAATYIATVQRSYSAKPWLSWVDRSLSDGSGTTSIDDAIVGTGLNQFEYVGTWWEWDEEGASHGYTHGSWETNDYYQVRFAGSRVAVYATVDAGSGPAAVSIDGGPETPVTFFSPIRTTGKAVFVSGILPSGPHTIRVRNTGSGTLVRADRVDITSP